MEEIILFGTALTVVTMAIVETVKRTKHMPKRYVAPMAAIVGIILGGVTFYIPEIASDLSLGASLFAGLASGLMASGAWEVGKNQNGYTKENDKEVR